MEKSRVFGVFLKIYIEILFKGYWRIFSFIKVLEFLIFYFIIRFLKWKIFVFWSFLKFVFNNIEN